MRQRGQWRWPRRRSAQTNLRLPLQDPIAEQANLSTDGVMMLVRKEGWKEVKLTTISAVEQIEVRPSTEGQAGRGREARAHVLLCRHSYQAGLWDADTMAQQQYAEGVRRGLEGCAQPSSVNDGAVWIERITRENFPEAVQIVDWSHASERLWAVGTAVFGAQSAQVGLVKEWESKLWQGKGEEVVVALQELKLEQGRYPQEVQQAAGGILRAMLLAWRMTCIGRRACRWGVGRWRAERGVWCSSG